MYVKTIHDIITRAHTRAPTPVTVLLRKNVQMYKKSPKRPKLLGFFFVHFGKITYKCGANVQETADFCGSERLETVLFCNISYYFIRSLHFKRTPTARHRKVAVSTLAAPI